MIKRKILDRIIQLDEKQLEQIVIELDVKTDDIKAYANGSISNEDNATTLMRAMTRRRTSCIF